MLPVSPLLLPSPLQPCPLFSNLTLPLAQADPQLLQLMRQLIAAKLNRAYANGQAPTAVVAAIDNGDNYIGARQVLSCTPPSCTLHLAGQGPLTGKVLTPTVADVIAILDCYNNGGADDPLTVVDECAGIGTTEWGVHHCDEAEECARMPCRICPTPTP